MSKYEDLVTQVFSIFDSQAWKSQGIKTIPDNYLAKDTGSEFIRVSVIPSGGGLNLNSLSGVLLIAVFVSANNGPKRLFQIADKLDNFLLGKTVKTTSDHKVQFKGSSLSSGANDSDNPTLYRNTYSIPFNYFGVF